MDRYSAHPHKTKLVNRFFVVKCDSDYPNRHDVLFTNLTRERAYKMERELNGAYEAGCQSVIARLERLGGKLYRMITGRDFC